MKKKLAVLSALCLMLLLVAACSGNGTARADRDIAETRKASGGVESVDVDLTGLSSTMAYAEVNNIVTNPENYFGKTIRMRGSYYAEYYDVTDLYYHFVVVEDVTACCRQGMEFVWNGKHNYPDDYISLAETAGIITDMDSGLKVEFTSA